MMGPMASTTPRAVRVKGKENLLEVEWDDDRVSRYDGGYLRWVCPCAECRGHAPGQVEPPAWERCAGVRIVAAAGVGGYAIRFDFSDGHGTGIYSWDWLRAQAPEDRPDRDATGRPKGG
jgi:DUF971 family protein